MRKDRVVQIGLIITVGLLAAPAHAQESRPVFYSSVSPSNPCKVITSLWNNWLLGLLWQCKGTSHTANTGTWQLISNTGGSGVWGGIIGTLSAQTDLNSALAAKEDVANKDTDGTMAANSDVRYPSQKAVVTYVGAHGGGDVSSVGSLSPLFSTANPNTTPTFSLLSQAQNLFFASPNGSTGAPSWRALVAADLPLIPLSGMSNLAANTFLGNNTGSSATPLALTIAQSTAALNPCTATLKGLVPTPPNSTSVFLRGDCTFATPAAGGSPGGSSNDIQVNNAGSFGGGRCTMDSSQNIVCTGTVTASAFISGGATNACDGTAGCDQFGQGTAPTALPTTGIQEIAPTSVTSYRRVKLAAGATTGLLHLTTSASPVNPTITESVSLIVNADITASTIDLTSKVTGVLPNANTTAASANTASAIVARDGSGNFSAGTVTAALTGNASTATALAANGTNCSGGTPLAAGVDASGNAEGCTGLAPTATALAANGSNCSAGQFAAGVDASGNAEGCAGGGARECTQAFSATITLDFSSCEIIQVTVTAAITSVAFSNASTNRANLQVIWIMSGGGWSVAGFGGTLPGWCTPQATTSITTIQSLTYDGTNLNGNGCSVISSSTVTAGLYTTLTNCSSSAAPAVCADAPAGSVVVAASATTVIVNTTAVTANSQILLTFDSSLGSKLSVTCNTTPSLPSVSARSAGTSFTITTSAPTTNPACLSFAIIN